MVVEYSCPTCKSVEFSEIRKLHVDENQKLVELVDDGILKCSNCATRYQIGPDMSIVMIETAPQGSRTPRVRSSVSASVRGRDSGGTQKF